MPNSHFQLQNGGLKQPSRDWDEVQHSAFRTKVSSEERGSLETLVQGCLGQSRGSGIFLHVLPAHLFPLSLSLLRPGLWAGLCWVLGCSWSVGQLWERAAAIPHPGTSWLGHWDGMFGMSLGTGLALSTSFSLQRWFVGRRIKLGFVRCEHLCWLCSAGLTRDPAGVGTRETLQLLLLLL